MRRRQVYYALVVSIFPFAASFFTERQRPELARQKIPQWRSTHYTQGIGRTSTCPTLLFTTSTTDDVMTEIVCRTPMVDSSLLRFLSQKKKAKRLLDANNNNVTIRLDYIEMGDKSISQIAQLLMDLKGDPEDAHAAADVVESMAVSRHSRRQWRNYLKERKELFSATNTSSAVAATTSTHFASSMDDDLDNVHAVIRLMKRYGFTGRDIAIILGHTPSIAFLRPDPDPKDASRPSLRTNLDRVFVQLLMGRGGVEGETTGLGLRKYDARKVLRNTPGVLSCKGAQTAIDMVIIMTSLGVSKKSLSRDTKGLSVLLRRSPAAVFRLVSFLVGDSVRMPLHQVGPLIRRSACQPLLKAVAPIEGGKSRRFQRELTRTVVDDTYRRMATTASTLIRLIGPRNLSLAIAAFPGLLLLDARRHILPMAGYLIRDLGVGEYLPRVLQLYPVILRMDLDHLQTVVGYFRSLDISDESLAIIARSFPKLLTLDVEHDMEPVIQFLQDEVGIKNVGRFVTRFPPILGYSVDRELRPKFEYLKTVLPYPKFEVSKFPAFFSYPIERSRLRFGFLLSFSPRCPFTLDEVLRHGDADFLRLVGDANGTRYNKFLQQYRRKRTSSTTTRDDSAS